MLIYNRESLVPRAIQSVRNQTVPNWKLIIVDNASRDRSGALAERYAKIDPRISVVHRTDSNITRGRAEGINLALSYSGDGDYIAFLDDDDEYYPDFLEKALPFAAENGLDVAAVGCEFFNGATGDYIGNRLNSHDVLVFGQGFLDLFIDYHQHIFTLWGKLFRAEILRGIDLGEAEQYSYGEDTLTVIETLMKAECFGVLAESLYKYYIYTDSVSYRYASSRMAGIQACFEAKIRLLENKVGYLGEAAVSDLVLNTLLSVKDSLTVLIKADISLAEKAQELNRVLDSDFIKWLYNYKPVTPCGLSDLVTQIQMDMIAILLKMRE
jgi:glycosyltransferase involved in cell wall biosynthesis